MAQRREIMRRAIMAHVASEVKTARLGGRQSSGACAGFAAAVMARHRSGFAGSRPVAAGLLAGLLEQPQQFAVHGVVAGGDVALVRHGVAAVEIGDEAAGLAHQDHAGGHVPRRQIALPIGIEPAGGDPGEVERGGAEAAQPGEMLLRRGNLPARRARGRRGRNAAVRRRPRLRRACCRAGDAQPPVVEERAFAALGDEQVVVRRIVGQRRRR